ncbi:MAG: hypothetical protein GY762_20235 [Proteobacteria bacterium]|nr:hypothetical protein [Pseudomonadota bacterium]
MARLGIIVGWILVACSVGACQFLLRELEKTDISIDGSPDEQPGPDDIWVRLNATCDETLYPHCADLRPLSFQCSEGVHLDSVLAPKYNKVWTESSFSFPLSEVVKQPNSVMGVPIEEGWPEGPITCQVYLDATHGDSSPNSDDLYDFDRFFALKRGEINDVDMDLTEQPAPDEVWIELNVDCTLPDCNQDKTLGFYGYDGGVDNRPDPPKYTYRWSDATFPHKEILKEAEPGVPWPQENITMGAYYDLTDGDGVAAKGDPQYTDRTRTLVAGTMNRVNMILHGTPPDTEAWMYVHIECDLAECEHNDEIMMYFYEYPIVDFETYPLHYNYFPRDDGYPEYITFPIEGLFKFSYKNRVDFPGQTLPWPTDPLNTLLGGAFVDYDKETECYISPLEPSSQFRPFPGPPTGGPIPDPLAMEGGKISHVNITLELDNPSFDCMTPPNPDAGP